MNIGVCGTGTIASWVSDILNQLGDEGIVLYSCATSPGFDCTGFAEKYGYKKISASYDELMGDPQVDLVYIAVPNHMHYELCMKAVAAGKNVVCEKPFSVRASECEAVLRAAKEKGVFINEALWPLFLPANKYINEVIASGLIGDVVSGEVVMLGDVMFLERVKHLETGGGEILDEGPYTLGFVVCHFGTDVEKVESRTRKLDTGVDAEDEILLTYKNGVTVRIHERMDTPRQEGRQYAEIVGTKGKIRVDAVGNPQTVEILDGEGGVLESYKAPAQIGFRGMPPVSGYEHEWIAFEKALREGKKECEEASNEMTRTIARIITAVHENAGIVFPF